MDTSPDVLNQKYTFESFIAGECNCIALKAAKAVAAKPTEIYNPLFVYGGVGTGKTHLVQAIGNDIKVHDSSVKVWYISTEKFINELILHIKDDRYSDFVNRFIQIDVLIIDDLQYFEGKERSQEVLCNVLNELILKGGQVILSANKPPESLIVLKERFTSLFEMGAAVKLNNLDINVIAEALNRYCKSVGIALTQEVIGLITNGRYEGMRELKGTLNRIKALADLSGQDIDAELVRRCLTEQGRID